MTDCKEKKMKKVLYGYKDNKTNLKYILFNGDNCETIRLQNVYPKIGNLHDWANGRPTKLRITVEEI